MFTRPTLSVDFEYNKSSEPNPNLVCCSLSVNDIVEEYWLLNDKDEQRKLADRLTELKDSHYHIAHAATAESRCYIALGLDPTKFQWIDTYLERKQLTNKCDEFKYGTYFDKEGNEKCSVKPSFSSWKNAGNDNTELYANFAHSVGRHLGRCVDTAHKDEMRNIILSCDDELIERNRSYIQEYCTSDILPLYDLAVQMNRDVEKVTHLTTLQIEKAALRRGRFAADTAWMEHNGIPLDMNWLKNLQNNYDLAKDELIEDLVNNHYPFFVREMDTKFKSNIKGVWKFKTARVVQFIEENNLQKDWPRTEPNSRNPFGNYKTDKDTLSTYSHIPELKALAECNKQIGQLKWFRPLPEADIKRDGDFMDAVGSDGMLRTFFGILGTQTGRNAPPAKRFILAMSSWLRCLIKPPLGEVIIAKDWGSQEFAVAALLSGDEQMVKAYFSNDPYLYFMKMAGAVPQDANPKWVKAPALALSEQIDFVESEDWIDVWHLNDRAKRYLENTFPNQWCDYLVYQGYELQRNLGKSTTLGLQFGLGIENLAKKLTLDTGTEVTYNDAKKLVNQHKKLYRVFWKWVDGQIKQYKKNNHLTLWDGWTLLGDNDNDLSVKNFPVQGCLQPHERVLTSSGYMEIGELHDIDTEGMTVWTGTSWEKFTTLNRGRAQFARLELTNGLYIDCDNRHEVLVVTEQGYVFKHYKDLTVDDEVCVSIPTPKQFGKYPKSWAYTPQSHNGVPFTVSNKDQWAFIGFLLGLITGDGNVYKHNIQLCFGDRKIRDILPRLNFGLRELGLKDATVRKASGSKGVAYSVTIYSSGLSQLVQELGIPTKSTSRTKRVPRWIWTAPLTVRKRFIRGYVETDGCVSRDQMYNIHTPNKLLLQDTQRIGLSIGVGSKIIQTGEGNYKLSWEMPTKLTHTLGYETVSGNLPTVRNMSLPPFLVDTVYDLLRDKMVGTKERAILNKMKKKSISVSTAHHFLTKYDCEIPVMYYHYKVKTTNTKVSFGDTYTLSVKSPLHRYDSGGIISKNTAACIMRLAVQKATDYGVKIMCPLHDAIYARCYDNEADIEWTKQMMDKAMDEAVDEVLGDRLKIRIDTDVHTHDDVWIEGKGKANYERLSKFLEKQEGSIESKRSIRDQFFSRISSSLA